MLKIDDLSDSLSRTWDTVSQGWNHLIRRAENALTHFQSDNEKGENIPINSPRWGLLNADMFDDADKLVVKLETPGLDPDDFDINVVDNILTISGEKRFQQEQTKGEYRVLECAYGRFTRSISLGYEVDEASAKASYDKGILKIELQKKPHQRRRKVTVN